MVTLVCCSGCTHMVVLSCAFSHTLYIQLVKSMIWHIFSCVLVFADLPRPVLFARGEWPQHNNNNALPSHSPQHWKHLVVVWGSLAIRWAFRLVCSPREARTLPYRRRRHHHHPPPPTTTTRQDESTLRAEEHDNNGPRHQADQRQAASAGACPPIFHVSHNCVPCWRGAAHQRACRCFGRA
jgi:hypothetical protein